MSTVVYTFPAPKAYRLGTSPQGMIQGSCTLTNYNSGVADNVLPGYFKSGTMTAVGGVSSNGYAMSWNQTTNTWMAYTTGTALSGVLAAAAANANVGTFSFIAMGRM